MFQGECNLFLVVMIKLRAIIMPICLFFVSSVHLIGLFYIQLVRDFCVKPDQLGKPSSAGS